MAEDVMPVNSDNQDNVIDDIPEDAIDEADLVLTTIDNPYNPKIDYLKWKQWDEESGYNTEAYVARLLMMEENFDIDDELGVVELTNKVVNDILNNDPLNVYALAK